MNYNPSAQMFTYDAWATRTLLKRINELPSSVMQQEVNTSFPTIARGFSHMFAVETIWYHVLTGMDIQQAMNRYMPLEQEMSGFGVEEFAAAFETLAQQVQAWLQAEPDLERSILLVNPYTGSRETRLSEILLHLVNHGTYHRGNISAMLRQLGHASTMTDYVLFWYQNPVDEAQVYSN